MRKEIGGYIELDTQNGSLYHDSAIALNCGRAAFEYLINTKDIRTVWIPYFCCDAILQPCRKHHVNVNYYHVGADFNPVIPNGFSGDDWLYIINYYGQISNEKIGLYKLKYKNIIVDNAQDYFRMPFKDTDTLYTCRKFFGVSDGAFLYTDTELDGLPCDYSYERVHYILGRFEKTAEEFYKEASGNNDLFDNEPIKRMSRLTDNLLRAIDYETIRERRTENFTYLFEYLKEYNRLNLSIPEGAFMYPLYVENGETIRKALQEKKVYIPMLWPGVLEWCTKESREYDMAINILPLPVDQRYNLEDMAYLVDEVKMCLS